MTFDTATHCELRSHHAASRQLISYEVWLSALIDIFESSFPELPVQTYPNTFLVWVRANASAIRSLRPLPVTLH